MAGGVTCPWSVLGLLPALTLPLLQVLPPSALAQQEDPLALRSSANPSLRVLVQEAELLRVGGTGGLTLRDPRGRELTRLPAGSRLSLRPAGGQVVAESDVPGSTAGRSLTLAEVWLEPLPDAAGLPSLQLEKRRYRGRLQVRPVAGGRLQAINHIATETYLPSVVGSEMPASWPLEALRAQAVAARTYALRQRKPAAPFDLRATVASQVYKGLEAETPSTREAVRTTRGLVLMHGNALINAVFHSSSGGVTENSGDLWTRQTPYLVSVPDFDQASPVHRWEKPLTPDLLRRAFAEIGGVRRIDVLSTTGSGRIRQARVVGPAGQLVLSGAELRNRLGLRSTLVRFEAAPFSLVAPAQPLPVESTAPVDSASGPMQLLTTAFGAPLPPPSVPLLPPSPVIVAIGRGFGHGVGMSQWGAYALAQRGQPFDQILRHYYRGAELRPFRDTKAPPVVSDVAPEPGSAAWMSRSEAPKPQL